MNRWTSYFTSEIKKSFFGPEQNLYVFGLLSFYMRLFGGAVQIKGLVSQQIH